MAGLRKVTPVHYIGVREWFSDVGNTYYEVFEHVASGEDYVVARFESKVKAVKSGQNLARESQLPYVGPTQKEARAVWTVYRLRRVRCCANCFHWCTDEAKSGCELPVIANEAASGDYVCRLHEEKDKDNDNDDERIEDNDVN